MRDKKRIFDGVEITESRTTNKSTPQHQKYKQKYSRNLLHTGKRGQQNANTLDNYSNVKQSEAANKYLYRNHLSCRTSRPASVLSRGTASRYFRKEQQLTRPGKKIKLNKVQASSRRQNNMENKSNIETDSSSSSSGSSSDSTSSDSDASHIDYFESPQSPTENLDTSSATQGSPTNDGFVTAEESPEADEEGNWQLTRITIPHGKLIFYPPPRRIIFDPRYYGYKNMDYNFEKEWRRLFDPNFKTPIIPLVKSRNKQAGQYDPRQLAMAPSRTKTAEQTIKGGEKPSMLKKILRDMDSSLTQVIPPADFKKHIPKQTGTRGTSRFQTLKFNPTFVQQQGKNCSTGSRAHTATRHHKTTPSPSTSRQPDPRPSRTPPAPSSSRQSDPSIRECLAGINKPKLRFMPSRAAKFRYKINKQTPITNPQTVNFMTAASYHKQQTFDYLNSTFSRDKDLPSTTKGLSAHKPDKPARPLFSELVPLPRPDQSTSTTVPTPPRRSARPDSSVSAPQVQKSESFATVTLNNIKQTHTPIYKSHILHCLPQTPRSRDPKPKQPHRPLPPESQHHQPGPRPDSGRQRPDPAPGPHCATGNKSKRPDPLEIALEAIFGPEDSQVHKTIHTTKYLPQLATNSTIAPYNAQHHNLKSLSQEKTPAMASNTPMDIGPPPAKSARTDISNKYQTKSEAKKAQNKPEKATRPRTRNSTYSRWAVNTMSQRRRSYTQPPSLRSQHSRCVC